MSDLESLYFKPRGTEEYPLRRGNTIEPGNIYRTRAGDRVRIYAKEGRELHGAILLKGVWYVDVWKSTGKYAAGKGEQNDRDIIINPPIEITLGQQYKSRDGRPCKVFELNKQSMEFPVIGAIKDEHGNWLPRVWNLKGVCKIPYGANNDIVAPWSET